MKRAVFILSADAQVPPTPNNKTRAFIDVLTSSHTLYTTVFVLSSSRDAFDNPSVARVLMVLAQMALTNNRDITLTSRHLRSPQITWSYFRSPQVTSGHLRSPQVTSDHLSSPQLTSGHLRSFQVTLESERYPHWLWSWPWSWLWSCPWCLLVDFDSDFDFDVDLDLVFCLMLTSSLFWLYL